MGLTDLSNSYKNNNITFLNFGKFPNFVDGFLCFLNNFEKLTYLVIAPGPSIRSL